ncbi:MAG: hypothetical protein A2545_06380 [Planctomycetes bacterium RIFOXYD2_FULL_41_16]|uniref:type II toxin-antitoxin system VapC family toxin n=1 Tax=Candidatus Wunengus californicus TaxID=3367619 RepID=UPI0008BFCEA0|nr:MAG: hypothetical protein A3K50_06960 [Planctomycetes bacterium RIFOXYD12_FULL_42_12]OHC07211.1 MAG: hypothetical protein A3J92_03730 [Planctomycetes bacterium RIFOXYC2_FULL_41_27]OHC08368.1 MAG: hypothetical protein A2545_06380 [Planctomycetes bacterium RIFOXYD2_FULL_41_16]
MKETVYIETSVVSYFASKPGRDLVIAGRQEITREKWPKILEFFEVYISTLVLQEAEQGDPEAAQKRLNVITNLPVLAITDEVEKLASILISEGPIPDKNPEDALHIAIATVNGIDYLLTWNFTHINNAQMKSKIISVVEKYGYPCPIICSPEELLGE